MRHFASVLCAIIILMPYASQAREKPLCHSVDNKWNEYIIYAIINPKENGPKPTTREYVKKVFGKSRCDVLRAIVSTFTTPTDIASAIHITLGETGFDPTVRLTSNREDSCGPTQINTRAHTDLLREKIGNVSVDAWCDNLTRDPLLAMTITQDLMKRKRGWSIWSASTKEAYLTYREYKPSQ